jgi:uncharacterized phage-like protein YoqJ
MRTVTFCGHSDCYEPGIKSWLQEQIEKAITQGAEEFLLGGYGGFDNLAATVVWEFKSKYPQIQSILVLPYLDRKVASDKYDSTTYPPLETVPKRYAISRRNQWMVEQADVVIAYVTHGWGGAAKTLEYAKRKKKTIINYADAMTNAEIS